MNEQPPVLSVVPDIVTPTLFELARTINDEHRQVVRSGEAMVEHSIRAGEALIQAHAQCARGEWLAWLEANFDGHPTMAVAYMRVAFYQEEIRAQGLTKYRDIREHLRGLPGPTKAQDPGYPEAIREQALTQLASGLTTRQVAETLGVSRRTIRGWVDPNFLEAERERKRRARRPSLEKLHFIPDKKDLAMRVRQVVTAHASGNRQALRAALYDLATICHQWCDHLDQSERSEHGPRQETSPGAHS